MCIVSMVFDRYDKIWPRPKPNIIPKYDPPSHYPNYEKDLEIILKQKSAIDLFQEIVRLTKQLDELLGLKDCEDPSKMKWLEDIKKVIKEEEAKRVDKQLELPF